MDIKKNLPLIAGLGIPLGMVLLIVLSLIIPSLFSKPKHNFVFVTNNTDRYDYNTTYSPGMYSFNGISYAVSDGRLVQRTQVYYTYRSAPENNEPKLYSYDVKSNRATEITYQQAMNYRLDASSIAPDGFEITYGSRSSGIFPIFYDSSRDYSTRYLRKGMNNIKLNLPLVGNTPYYDYYGNQGFQLLGWIVN